MLRFSLLLGILFATVGVARTQTLSDFERSRYSPAAYYNYAEPGDVTVVVNVWGTVRNPGLYEIPQGTHLSTLLSVAGGPIVAPRQNREDRTISIRLFRGQTPVFATVMTNDILATPNDPVLLPGDVLTVETLVRQRFSMRDFFPIVAAVASVALAVERIATVR